MCSCDKLPQGSQHLLGGKLPGFGLEVLSRECPRGSGRLELLVLQVRGDDGVALRVVARVAHSQAEVTLGVLVDQEGKNAVSGHGLAP